MEGRSSAGASARIAFMTPTTTRRERSIRRSESRTYSTPPEPELHVRPNHRNFYATCAGKQAGRRSRLLLRCRRQQYFTVRYLRAGPHDKAQPVTYNYTFIVDQVMPLRSNLEISYVGNQSSHTFTEGNLSNQNYIPLGGLFQPDPDNWGSDGRWQHARRISRTTGRIRITRRSSCRTILATGTTTLCR